MSMSYINESIQLNSEVSAVVEGIYFNKEEMELKDYWKV